MAGGGRRHDARKPLRNLGEKIPTPPWRADSCLRLILPITPPLRGSRGRQAARRRLLRWGVGGTCGSPSRGGVAGALAAPPTGATSGLRPRLADSPSRGEWCVRAAFLPFGCVTACDARAHVDIMG
ncbi:MAG: hypothetical protein OXU61_10965 [Gammaproteobacteria bacterium]|nr:hypothetical protein [Gammaproteobacteria bacterium]